MPRSTEESGEGSRRPASFGACMPPSNIYSDAQGNEIQNA
jgi:hypothetical protein